MQPNKSVEERFEEVFGKEPITQWRFTNLTASGKEQIDVRSKLLKFIKESNTSHTNTVLQGVVEKIKNKSEEAVKGLWYVSEDTFSSVLNDQIISNEEKK